MPRPQRWTVSHFQMGGQELTEHRCNVAGCGHTYVTRALSSGRKLVCSHRGTQGAYIEREGYVPENIPPMSRQRFEALWNERNEREAGPFIGGHMSSSYPAAQAEMMRRYADTPINQNLYRRGTIVPQRFACDNRRVDRLGGQECTPSHHEYRRSVMGNDCEHRRPATAEDIERWDAQCPATQPSTTTDTIQPNDQLVGYKGSDFTSAFERPIHFPYLPLHTTPPPAGTGEPVPEEEEI